MGKDRSPRTPCARRCDCPARGGPAGRCAAPACTTPSRSGSPTAALRHRPAAAPIPASLRGGNAPTHPAPRSGRRCPHRSWRSGTTPRSPLPACASHRSESRAPPASAIRPRPAAPQGAAHAMTRVLPVQRSRTPWISRRATSRRPCWWKPHSPPAPPAAANREGSAVAADSPPAFCPTTAFPVTPDPPEIPAKSPPSPHWSRGHRAPHPSPPARPSSFSVPSVPP